MKKEPKDKIFKLFKKELKKPDNMPAYEEEDWKQLEKILDKDKKHGGSVNWMMLMGSIAAMFFHIFGWWFFIDAPVQPVPIAKYIGKKAGLPKEGSNGNTLKSAGLNNVKKGSAVAAKGNNHLALTKSGKLIAAYPIAITKAAANFSGKPEFLEKARQISVFSQNPSGSQIMVKSSQIYLDADSYSIVRQNGDKETIVAKTKRLPPITLSVMASPDLNSIYLLSKTKTGINAGLMVSVGLFKKLTLSTGVSYARKPYLTDFDDYHTGYRFPVTPESVMADCRVLDIPLNLNYELYHQKRNKISVSSGLSSYLMLRENYHFNYRDPDNSGPADYNISNKNKHILGILNMGIMYQRQLNSKFDIGVQPYLKMPLTNIGYGEIKLRSAGIAVNLSWQLNPSQKP